MFSSSHSVVSNSVTSWTAAWQVSLSITNSQTLFKLIHRVSDANKLSHPMLSPFPWFMDLTFLVHFQPVLHPALIKLATVPSVSPSICHEVMGPFAMILVFWMLSFKPTFSFSTFTFIKRLFSSSSFCHKGWCHLHIWGYWYFSQQSWFQLMLHSAQCFSWCTLHRS